MPLLDLKTDLKSLKYGNDQPGGGSSGQPYVTTDINTVDTGFNRFRLTKFDDGLVRGGFVGATNASVADTIRIGKFLIDLPKGPLFIAKQVGLQLSNPKLETKAGVTGFFQSQPTRIYNLGINTLAQVPVNAFGGHLNRHGLLPVQDEQTKYFFVALSNNNKDNNRLVKLKNKLIGTEDNVIDNYTSGPSSVYGIGRTLIRRRGDFIVVNQDITENEWARVRAKELGGYYRINGHGNGLDGYDNAFKRIGNFIGVSLQTSSLFTPETFRLLSQLRDNLGDQTISTYKSTLVNASLTSDNITSSLGSGSNAISNYSEVSTDSSEIIVGIDKNSIRYTSLNKTYADLLKQINNQQTQSRSITPVNETSSISSNQFGIYNDGISDLYRINTFNGDLNGLNSVNPDSDKLPTYTNGRYYVKLNKAWNKIHRENNFGVLEGKDQINLTPIFEAKAGNHENTVNIPGVGEKNINDLVPFRIQALNGNNPTDNARWMIFRAYLTQFTDNTDPIWNPIRYVGRGEEFYIYGGFTRKIQISFKVAALSSQEMEPIYQKLNYLMGNVMPDYNNNLMRGPIVKMTVGNWIDGQDGILTSLNYTIPNDSPWEISINGVEEDKLLILPHVVEVNLGFTPIGSQTKGINKIAAKSTITSHIAQNYEGYQYIKPTLPRRGQVIVSDPNRISEEQFNNPLSST